MPIERAFVWMTIAAGSALLAVLPGCGDGGTNPPGQVMAHVNDAEITVHQVNSELARRNAQGEAKNGSTSRQIMEALVDQQLLVEQAINARLDRDPQVLQALEHARRQILSQAYLERSISVDRPTADDVKAFYEEHPALFRNRRIFSSRDFVMEREQLTDTLRARLEDPRLRDDVAGQLKAAQVAFRETSSVRPAEQLPIDMLPRLAAMEKGEITVLLDRNIAVVMQLMESSEAPVLFEKAVPYIEQYLINARRKLSAENRIKELRAAAKISYVGSTATHPNDAAPAARVVSGSDMPVGQATDPAQSSTKGLHGLTGK